MVAYCLQFLVDEIKKLKTASQLWVIYHTIAQMSDYEDDVAEAWEGSFMGGGGGGGKKYKAKPSHVGRVRVGGNAWGSGSESACPKNCLKKCCKKVSTTPKK